MLKLYTFNFSHFSEKARWTLSLAGNAVPGRRATVLMEQHRHLGYAASMGCVIYTHLDWAAQARTL